MASASTLPTPITRQRPPLPPNRTSCSQIKPEDFAAPLGMISNKMSVRTIYGHKYFKHELKLQNLKFFNEHFQLSSILFGIKFLKFEVVLLQKLVINFNENYSCVQKMLDTDQIPIKDFII